MITVILSFLVFILVQGCAVCDDLYPISVLRGMVENQVEGASDVNNATEPRFISKEQYVPTDPFIRWVQRDIVQYYGFRKDKHKIEWQEEVGQPTFENALLDPRFRKTAEEVEEFFKKNIDWKTTKNTFSHIDVLYLTAARYLLVTKILFWESPGHRLIPCLLLSDGRYQIPAQGVCYPAPYGSAGWSSDYDVGLIGKSSGTLTMTFNQYFEKTFKTPSEFVFDTNVYAFTLEYAMPFMFEGLPQNFVKDVANKEKTVNFKMQELASAYYKVYKYNKDFFETLKTGAKDAMHVQKASQSIIQLHQWLETFKYWDGQAKLRLDGYGSLLELREKHNSEYQDRVAKMSQKGYQAELLGELAIALIYAAEAYHTRGAIRHVVGGTQFKVMAISPNIRQKIPLSTYDLWVSMIENWGESNKEYNHCKKEALKKCFLKMCKYMWRMFNAMSLIRNRIPATERPGLVHFGEAEGDPEYAMKMWLAYKKQGNAELDPNQENKVKVFLKQFHCDGAAANINAIFPLECISKMNDAVNLYNVKLAKLVTDKSV